MTTNLISLANAHGFEAIARNDAAAVAIFIPTTTPVFYADGSVAFYEDGVEMVEVSNRREALQALGY